MTHTDYTKEILNIKDENIYFYENCLENRKINGVNTKIFKGYLTYTPKYCPCCGVINESTDDIIKWNYKRNCKIILPKISNYNAILILDKQRFYCKHCHSTFIAETNLIDKYCNISNNTKLSVKLDLMNKISEKDISIKNNVSHNYVNRILHELSLKTVLPNAGILPDIINIDEFKATRDTVGKMAFIIVDQTNKNIFDINNSRLSLDIEKYFKNYSKNERDKVKFITMDLYKLYYKLMHSLFKNAILVPDRFHIIIQVRNALDKTRIKLCVKSNKHYTKLKKYWKLILKDKRELKFSPLYRFIYH